MRDGKGESQWAGTEMDGDGSISRSCRTVAVGVCLFWIVDEVPGGRPLDVLAVLVLTAGWASQSGAAVARDLKKHGWGEGANKPIKKTKGWIGNE